MHLVWSDVAKLLLAAALGGVIGLEREAKHRPAGLRTNLFICVGAALYTLLSIKISGNSTDPTRIASQIIPGIGFIGAGSIIHARAD
ncbi:MAG TPA: MgtC/SapB family protein, partial [Bryobacteraceae bacterium]